MAKRKPKIEAQAERIAEVAAESAEQIVETSAIDRFMRVKQQVEAFFGRQGVSDRDYELRYLVATEWIYGWWEIGTNRAIPRPGDLDARVSRILGLK